LYPHQLRLDARRFLGRRFSNFLRYRRAILKASREHSNDLLREREIEIGSQASVVAGAGPDIVAKKAGRISILWKSRLTVPVWRREGDRTPHPREPFFE
jgi:hypothetical protein